MLNLLWLIYVPVVVYLGFEAFPLWTPLVAGIAGAAIYCLQPKAWYGIGNQLFGYDNQPASFGEALADLVNGKNPKGAAGLFYLFFSMYVMYAILAFVLFGIGWGFSLIF